MSYSGRPEVAFEMATQLRWGGIGQLAFLLEAYSYLKKAKGEQAAVTWLRGAVPPPLIKPSTMFSFQNNHVP
jgi:hypothetical protein